MHGTPGRAGLGAAAVIGTALTLASLAPSGETLAGWNQSAPQAQAALTMGRVDNVTFTDASRIRQLQGTPAAKTFGYGLQPTSYLMTPSQKSAARGVGQADLNRFLTGASGSGTTMTWGRDPDCGTTIASPVGTATWTGASTAYVRGLLTASAAAPVPRGTTPQRCARVAQPNWPLKNQVWNNGGQVFKTSTSYRVTMPGTDTWFSQGPDLSTATAHPAAGTPNVWTSYYGVPYPGPVPPPKTYNGSANLVCSASGSGDIVVWWAWPDPSSDSHSHWYDPAMHYEPMAPSIAKGSFEVWVRPKPGNANATPTAWRYVQKSDLPGDRRDSLTIGDDIDAMGDGTVSYGVGWYELAIVVYPYGKTSNNNYSYMGASPYFSVSPFVINVYKPSAGAHDFYCSDSSQAPAGTASYSTNSTTAADGARWVGQSGAIQTGTGLLTSGAHGWTTDEGVDINAEMSTAP